MVALDLQRINSESAYKVSHSVEMDYHFSTDFNVQYSVSFEADDLLQCCDSYQFSIINRNHKSSPSDKKLRETLYAIMTEFFRCNNTTLLYICETGDGKQSGRNRLFKYWFDLYPFKTDYAIFSANVKDEEGVVNYAAIILRIDNPKFTEITSEFSETIKLLSKP